MSEKRSSRTNEVKKKLFQYSPHKVGLALEAIKNGMKVATASKNYKVPRTTLRHKLSGHAPETSGHVGPQAVLGEQIETDLVVWIKECARLGFPIDKEGLFDSVKKIVEKGNLKTPFVNNRPSRSWFEGFMSRHPDLSQKHAEYINKARALITEEKIRNWYQEVSTLLGSENLKILDDPLRVWNCDETSFFLAPKGALVLAEKGKHVYDTSNNSDKENITTLFTVNAVGEYAPPLTVYKYKRMSSEIVQNAPDGWGLGKTDKGWMTGEAFYEYIGNVFIPYLKEKEIALPVILFLDGHKSHLTMHLSTLCRDNGIIVIALVPNTTHMMQPLDVAVFFPLKQNWRKLVKKWRIENDGKDITKFNLPKALHSLLVDNETFSNNVRAGFSTCGLYPFGPDFVNYKRVVQPPSNTNNNYEAVPKSTISESSYLTYLESKIDPSLLKDFYLTCESGTDWEGKKEAIMLYDIWLAFKNDTTNHPAVAKSKDIDDSPLFDICGINDMANEMHTPNKEISARDPSSNYAVPSKDIENPCLLASILINRDKENFDPQLPPNHADPSGPSFNAVKKNDITHQIDTPKNYNLVNQSSTSGEALSKDIEECLPTAFLETSETDGFAGQMYTPNKDNSNTDSAPPDVTSDVVTSVATPNRTEQAGSTRESTNDKLLNNLVRDCVLWPEKIIPKNTKKAKYIPSVLTSDKWMEIMQTTEKEKKNKELKPKIGNKRAKSLKRGTCDVSKVKKLKTIGKNSKNSVKRKVVHRSDSEESSEKCDEFSVHDTDDSLGEDENNHCDDQENKINYKMGDFVIFVYEGEYFVGQIEFLNKEEAQIKSMQKTAKNWKWPDRVDLNFYPYDDIKQKIATPKKVSKRDVYRVPEIEKYWEFST